MASEVSRFEMQLFKFKVWDAGQYGQSGKPTRLRCVYRFEWPKRLGPQVIRLGAKREPRRQVQVITSSRRDGASDTFESIPGCGRDIDRVLRFAEKSMNEEL